jgi:hypothetical protein
LCFDRRFFLGADRLDLFLNLFYIRRPSQYIGSRALEEVLKTIFFIMLYRTPAWYKKSVHELSPAAAK